FVESAFRSSSDARARSSDGFAQMVERCFSSGAASLRREIRRQTASVWGGHALFQTADVKLSSRLKRGRADLAAPEKYEFGDRHCKRFTPPRRKKYCLYVIDAG
ncbi:hypothetical protein ACWTQY_26735, partial [Klebsiella pneumoniae]